MSSLRRFFLFVLFCSHASLWAADCPTVDTPIATDRPDVTNSSSVVPLASFQVENGADILSDHGAAALAGTNTRFRLGGGQCNELLVDLPNYLFNTVKGAPVGFSDIAPAFKHQFLELPPEATISAVVGIGLPTGRPIISGRGAVPYAQTSWSYELSEDWAINSMQTLNWFAADSSRGAGGQSSMSLERALSEQADAFIEYIVDVEHHAAMVSRFNSGAAWRLTSTSQFDFHVGAGLNRHAPAVFGGIGYSFRFDR